MLEITFKDTGIGFANKYKEDIFTPFKRLQSSKDYEGTGIGLALVKKWWKAIRELFRPIVF